MGTQIQDLIQASKALTQDLKAFANVVQTLPGGSELDLLMMNITIFVLSCVIGYFVVWSVTPALHSPLMAVTNAISSVIIVGAIVAASGESFNPWAVFLASLNIVGGFCVTHRMLLMFQRKKSS